MRSSLPKTGIVLLGHGSRELSTTSSFRRLTRLYQNRHRNWSIHPAFLEFAKPSLQETLEKISRRCERIIVLPAFLFAARHWKKDIPKLIVQTHRNRSKVQIYLAPVLGPHPLMADLIQERLRSTQIKEESMVILVGRGASDPEMKKKFFRLAQKVEKLYKLPIHPCFYDLLKPTLTETLQKARTQQKKVVVMPYLLFKGKVLQQIVKVSKSLMPSKQLQIAPVLGLHENLLKVLDQRVQKAKGWKSI